MKKIFKSLATIRGDVNSIELRFVVLNYMLNHDTAITPCGIPKQIGFLQVKSNLVVTECVKMVKSCFSSLWVPADGRPGHD